MPNKKIILGGILALVVVGLIILIIIPPPEQCEGLENQRSICYNLASRYDKMANDTSSTMFYRLENGYYDTAHINIFSVYVENSASMDGYLIGTDFTKFKQTISAILKSGFNISDSINCSLINNKVSYICSDNSFARTKLNPDVVKNSNYGDRTNTEISDVLDSVISRTGENSVSVLFSDFVLSPKGSTERDIHNYIEEISKSIRGVMKKKLDSRPRLCVIFSRFMSEFSGTYYGAGDGMNKVSVKGVRPFYAFLIGDYGTVAKFMREYRDAFGEKPCLFMTTQTELPYGIYSGQLKQIGNNGHRHINKHLLMTDEIKNKVEKDSNIVTANLKVDLSCLPMDSSYLNNIANYAIDSDLFHLYRITTVSEDDAKRYTHVITLKSNKSTVPNGSRIRVYLKDNGELRPNWEDFNTFEGRAANTLAEDSLRTLGIEPLRKSIEEAFAVRSAQNGVIATFEFIIN